MSVAMTDEQLSRLQTEAAQENLERQLKTVSARARAQVKASHANLCPICLSPNGAVRFREAFLGFTSPTDLMTMFNVSEYQLQVHIARFKLQKVRAGNRRHMYDRMISLGMADPGKLAISARDVLRAAEHLDKLDGLVVDRKEINGPPRFNLVAVPQAGGVIDSQRVPVIKGTMVKVGPPMLNPAPEQAPKKEPANG